MSTKSQQHPNLLVGGGDFDPASSSIESPPPPLGQMDHPPPLPPTKSAGRMAAERHCAGFAEFLKSLAGFLLSHVGLLTLVVG